VLLRRSFAESKTGRRKTGNATNVETGLSIAVCIETERKETGLTVVIGHVPRAIVEAQSLMRMKPTDGKQSRNVRKTIVSQVWLRAYYLIVAHWIHNGIENEIETFGTAIGTAIVSVSVSVSVSETVTVNVTVTGIETVSETGTETETGIVIVIVIATEIETTRLGRDATTLRPVITTVKDGTVKKSARECTVAESRGAQ